MLANIHCATVQGIAAHAVEVEVNDGFGETLVVIVGLPDAAVRESRDRVITAFTNSGFKMPLGRITINLAPADIRKEGPSFDLAIGVGMLAASEQIESTQLERYYGGRRTRADRRRAPRQRSTAHRPQGERDRHGWHHGAKRQRC